MLSLTQSLSSLTLMVGLAWPAQAGKASNLSGRWQLDHSASSSLSEILKALSYGWISRGVMNALDVTQILETQRDHLSLRVVTRFGDDAIMLPTGSDWRPGRTLDGGQTLRRSQWIKPGRILRTEDQFKDGGLLITVRRLRDANTFEEKLEFHSKTRGKLEATRVFRRTAK